jgi:hypothetical protein
MKVFLILAFISFNLISFSQKIDSANCNCSYKYSVSYPKNAQENKIGGTVIIEFDMDTACVFSNPKIITGLGYGCDEEAMRVANQMINNSRKCAIKCSSQKCSNKKN